MQIVLSGVFQLADSGEHVANGQGFKTLYLYHYHESSSWLSPAISCHSACMHNGFSKWFHANTLLCYDFRSDMSCQCYPFDLIGELCWDFCLCPRWDQPSVWHGQRMWRLGSAVSSHLGLMHKPHQAIYMNPVGWKWTIFPPSPSCQFSWQSQLSLSKEQKLRTLAMLMTASVLNIP